MPTTIKEKMVKSFEILGFTCDRCKKDFPQDHDEDDGTYDTENQEMLNWHHKGGYGSVIGDGNFVHFTICQNCWWELFKDFAEVKVYGYDPDTGEQCYENTRKV